MVMLTPQQIAQLEQIRVITQRIKGKITVNYTENKIEFEMTAPDPEAQATIPSLLGQLSDQLAQQLSSFFAIEGEIIEIGK